MMADTAAGNLAFTQLLVKIRKRPKPLKKTLIYVRFAWKDACSIRMGVSDPRETETKQRCSHQMKGGLAGVMRRETKQRCGSWRHHHQDYAGNPFVFIGNPIKLSP
jgi:hypothetical protein